ncbi:hypothetical protein CHS0354_025873 [Potamilus streckersoni]|uniref:Uncharacterized protein n=1 Tax=Potamilus streckersoni TaxID=2493646 RepID=A0AAE0TJ52_9BIVA|nr:hypothetical protein CHS0354_025873 [Potamilus streckersoni]
MKGKCIAVLAIMLVCQILVAQSSDPPKVKPARYKKGNFMQWYGKRLNNQTTTEPTADVTMAIPVVEFSPLSGFAGRKSGTSENGEKFYRPTGLRNRIRD